MRGHVIALAAVLSAAAPAYADNALRPEMIPNKARELAEKGRRHHKAGDYSAAVSAFKEAYVLAPSPGLLFNIAQAYRLAGNCDEAAWMYRRFLDTNPLGKQRDIAETQLSTVEKCGTGGLRVNLTPPKLDANVPEPANAGRSTQPRGSLSMRGSKGSRIAETSPSAESAKQRRSSTYKRIGLYTAIGGGAAIVGATLFGLDAADAASTVEATYAHGGKWNDVKDADARGQRSATIATVMGVTGAAALVTGVVLYGVGHHYEQARYVAVTPTKHGAQVSLSWGF
jgi:tetratricopeptide (TPR) repeat protein